MVSSFSTKTNDQLLLIYLSSLIRAVIALHNLIDNKIDNLKGEGVLDSPEKEVKEPETATTEKSDEMQVD
jgi:26S proteasome regulatory subunit N8